MGNGITGKFNSSLTFDGTDDKINISSNPVFAYGTGDFTWSAWINGNNLTEINMF